MSQLDPFRKEKKKISASYSLVMILIITLMAREWLKPLLVLTDTYTIQPFVLYFALAMLVQWLSISRWVKAGIMIFFLFYFIHNLYIYDPFFSMDWVRFVTGELVYSLRLLLEGDTRSHSFIVLTLFFLLIQWFAAIIIYRFVLEKQYTLYFFILTIVFLAILDTFSPYSSMFPIIWTFIYGFILLSFKQITRLFPRSEDNRDTPMASFPTQWLWASVLVVGFVTAVGFLAPKAAPAWPDPVSFLQGYSDAVREGGLGGVGRIQRIGYGTNDEHLGGPFMMDDGLVFVAQTEGRGYWRGESKDIYTGKGWIQSEADVENQGLEQRDGRFHAGKLDLRLLNPTESNMTMNTVRSDIRFDQPRFATVFYPGDPQEVTIDPSEYPDFLEINRLSGSMNVYTQPEQRNNLYSYRVISDLPTFSTKALIEVSMDQVPQDIRQQYTQLPDMLPDRVRELALEITQEAETAYEKVKRIERFFKSNGFEYNIEEVAVPGSDEDYVDQFLFETKKGYCDNFSSSMVVLLRTLDIPARWVKGFTFGEVLTASNGEFTTEVRNRNAHSWVEVYFPTIGWVPFEPTQSFNNPFIFERDDIDLSRSNNEDLEYNPLEDPFSDSFEESLEEYSSFTPGGSGSEQSPWLSAGRIGIFLVLLAVLILVVAFFYRKNLILSWALIRYREAADRQTFFNLYEWLIRYLGRFTKPRDPSQTMREYVLELEQALEIEELKSITQVFEQMRYGKQQDNSQVDRAHQMWRTIVNKLKS